MMSPTWLLEAPTGVPVVEGLAEPDAASPVTVFVAVCRAPEAPITDALATAELAAAYVLRRDCNEISCV